MTLRSSDVCRCEVCRIVRYNFVSKNLGGEVATEGLVHKCNESTRTENLKRLLASSSDRSRAIVVSSELRKFSKKDEISHPDCPIAVSTLGRPMRVSINLKSSTSSAVISTEDIVKMQSVHNLSQRTTLGIVSTVRKATGKRKIVESHVKSKLKEAIHAVDEFFSVKNFNFTKNENGSCSEVTLTAVHCHDLKGLIEYVKNVRGLEQVLLKIGVDAGRGSLKICLSIQDSSNHGEVLSDES
ncbi:hypothetical protein QAD02_004022 [Eretmocerus hayati]|uniref:Uncharacterized protein n=1 Tax=Eretmocerus hayati TaxID=131215 RepID=A0ACC2NRA2_9HYME|nr:hypothetical protein QAD02_004022 [Eretmocerus hayati]